MFVHVACRTNSHSRGTFDGSRNDEILSQIQGCTHYTKYGGRTNESDVYDGDRVKMLESFF